MLTIGFSAFLFFFHKNGSGNGMGPYNAWCVCLFIYRGTWKDHLRSELWTTGSHKLHLLNSIFVYSLFLSNGFIILCHAPAFRWIHFILFFIQFWPPFVQTCIFIVAQPKPNCVRFVLFCCVPFNIYKYVSYAYHIK